jgi:hypothetical protein
MQKFEISRSNGVYPPQELAEKFARYGLVVLKGYLPADSRDDVRRILTEKLEAARTRGHVLHLSQYPKADFLLGDILSIRALQKYDYVFFKRELLEIAKVLLKSRELVYYGDSSTQFDSAARGFHKDHVERTNAATEDWRGDYGLIRCAFYCEDHSRHSGGLKVRIATHNVESCRSLFDKNKISHHAGKSVDVLSEYGDMVIWSMRLTHSGNYKKLKFWPGLSLHPRIEGYLPEWLTLPEQLRRYFMSCAFARPGAHFDHYIRNMLARDADYRQYLERARNADEAREFLAQREVTLLPPSDYYGRLDENY